MQALGVPSKKRSSKKEEAILPVEICTTSLQSQVEVDQGQYCFETEAEMPVMTNVVKPVELYKPAESCWPSYESYLTEEMESSDPSAAASHDVLNGPSAVAKKGSNRNCSIIGCYNTKRKNHSLSFYRFPDEVGEVHKARRRKWIQATKKVGPNNTPWVPMGNSYVCSAHFVGGRKVDVFDSPSYVPTIFPPTYRQQRQDDVKKTTGGQKRRQVTYTAAGRADGSRLLDTSAGRNKAVYTPWNQVAMATDEADDEITTEEDLFYAALELKPDCSPSSPSPFVSVRIKQEAVDNDERSNDANALAVVTPVEMVDVDSVAVKTEYDEDMIQWRDSNPDVDPLHSADIKEEVKEEINDEAVDCHKEATAAFSWPLFDSTEENVEEHPEPSLSHPGSSSFHPVSSPFLPASSSSHPASSSFHPASSSFHPASSPSHPASSLEHVDLPLKNASPS